MCYETSLTKTTKEIKNITGAKFSVPMEYKPYYHISGFVHPNLYCIPIEDPTQIFPMEWGLIAPWGENDVSAFRKKYNTLNARGETMLKSNTYKSAARERRCLILADGFFEPHYPGDDFKGGAVPKYCYLENRKLFTFAGIYNEYKSDYWNVSLVTTEANDFFSKVHNKKKRMPLVLDPDFEGEWLREDLNDNNILELVDHGFIKENFKAHSVANLYKRDLNTNTPEFLKPVEDQEGEQGSLF
ncbi:SOS response-associated peptidase [Zunongwangia endophytica]|uniref:Abasic site processing protein n=1 Tax=Zunongwangia endophytica TaxID=1808945 RepID=A0ABV8H7I6_9FLAO|nr:SOS response-associated peptidase family protein [Zunongwangia endophytica]MDN3595305.1 SOS response-associated peptidase family protein [Zunongwangia endophytica]